jgi:hypothetical protein
MAIALLATATGSLFGCGGSLPSGGGDPCPPGLVQCTDCNSNRYCSNACPGYVCPALDCAGVTTLELCDARPGCHSVFEDRQDCTCGGLGCCARFLRCAAADAANCSGGAVACDALAPYCEGPYVVSYAGACYEGCVRAMECAP